MITKEAIKNGFEKGVISIEDDYAGCLGACCRIGDNAFYFIDAEDAYLTKEEYWKSYTLNMTINMIFNVLKNVEAAEENGIDYMMIQQLHPKVTFLITVLYLNYHISHQKLLI